MSSPFRAMRAKWAIVRKVGPARYRKVSEIPHVFFAHSLKIIRYLAPMGSGSRQNPVA
jgi:hypothetical protein